MLEFKFNEKTGESKLELSRMYYLEIILGVAIFLEEVNEQLLLRTGSGLNKELLEEACSLIKE